MNKHLDIIKKLVKYKGFDSREEEMRLETIEFIKTNPNCFERSLLTGHINGGAWIINDKGTHALLTHHRKLDRWFQLGGHSDGEPNTYKVALKEAQEESGLKNIIPVTEEIFDIDVHPIPARGDEPEHKHYEIRFLFIADMSEKLHVSNESKDLSWVNLDKIPELNGEPAILRMIAKTREYQNSI